MMKIQVRFLAGFLVAVLLAVAARPALAAQEEIQVYTDDLSEPGHFGLDVHNNYVVSGDSTPAYPGQVPPRHEYRLTPEFYYGLTDTLELGLYILSTRSADGNSRIDGEKLRIKYIAPHDSKQGMYWGANLEIGKTDISVAPRPWNGELKGIWGYRTGPWLLGFNANLDWSLSSRGGPATYDLDGKIAYQVAERTAIGMETYNEMGSMRRLEPLGQNGKMLYAALDQEFDHWDLNAGVGRGLTPDSDRWVLKFIIGARF